MVVLLEAGDLKVATTTNQRDMHAATPSLPRMRRRRVRIAALVGYGVLAGIAVSGGRVLWRSVPFEIASYAAWAGIFLALFALASLVRVPRWLGVRTRTQASILLGLGVAVTSTALLWPASSENMRSHSQRRLDDFLPEYQSVEYHEARTAAPLDRVVDAMHRLSDLDMPGTVLLLRLRALASGEFVPAAIDPSPVFEAMDRPGSGFIPLDRSNRAELVYGMICRPWTNEPSPDVSGAEFLGFSAPGYVRVAFDFRVVQESSSSVKITTETRILGNDPASRKSFTWYWRLIYPGSAIIRRLMLDAVVARAEAASR